MKIVQLYDINIIRGVMMHGDILPTIVDDTWDGSAHTPDISNGIYLGCVVDEALIGIYYLHWLNGATLQGHAHILKEFRREYSIKSCHSVMTWLLEKIHRCKKVACFVPSVYPNVKQFLAVCGLKEEGILRKSFALNGQLHDQWIMGITRDEMQETLK